MVKAIAAGADPAAEAEKDDVDIVRAAIYFLGILLVGLVVVVWMLLGQRDSYRESVQYGERNLKAMAATYEEVRGLLKEYEVSGADEARQNTATWMKQRYTNAGIQQSQVTINPWKERATRDYVEHSVEVVVKDVPRDKAVQLLWNVERVSTKMRTIEARFRRTAPNNSPEADVWSLNATFGYRVPRGFKDGN